MKSNRNSVGVVLVTALLLGLGFGFHNLTLKNASPSTFISENNGARQALDLRDGDLIFQSSTQGQSLAVQLATRSKWSHVGMLFEVEGQWMVFEAVGPVKFTPLRTWIAHGEGHHYVVKRLVNADEV
ncbi:MAG: YiiX/YebB-like N1pC/P60 family cysteine hydrolase, partial [Cryomorphaceae bacterium]